ncbi:39S ribosomal protein L39, mitochondrial [Pectinophora gossypiella]|uniref:TGS domain-containing protein n=1 Tax=Pectinophora gossypiella TaxID=13191 RepID=A0A1E1WNL2_PECGO|nr:39S ribosomal protein L39, mitochondrial [Pectinophora gossypiella]
MKLHLSHISRHILHNSSSKSLPLARFLSTKEAIERRDHLFTLEKKRQVEKVGRVEKIEVRYKGVPNDCTLVMNKNISTPYDCAKHLSEWHTESSALALVDGHVHWDMHRPLSENCILELQTYTVAEPQQVNKAFWRTCSMMLGAVVSSAFKDNVPVKLHSFPGPDIRSGSFIYDVDLPTLPDWQPTQQEIHTLGAEFVKLVRQNLLVERLDVGEELAKEMFVENEHKVGQIPSIARGNANAPGKVTMYRIGKHVDISKGPMISCTGQVGRVTVAAVHALSGAPGQLRRLHRFQGLALPAGVVLNHFAYQILTDRAKKLNPARSPINPFNEEDSSAAPQAAAASA